MNEQDKLRRAAVLAAGVVAVASVTGLGRMFGDTPIVVIGLLVLFLSGPVLAVAWPGAISGGVQNPLLFLAPVLLGSCAGLISSPDGIAAGVAGAAGGILVSVLGKDLRLPGRLSQAAFAVLAVGGTRYVFAHWHGIQGPGLFVVLALASLGTALAASGLFRLLRRPSFLATAFVLGTILAGAVFRLVHDATPMQIRFMIVSVLLEFGLLTVVGARDAVARLEALPRASKLDEPLCAVPLLDRKKDVALEAYVD